MADLPAFKDLPGLKEARETQGCAWGLWDKNGVRDNLGTLNLITPDTILAAKAEIQHGVSVALNWAMQNIAQPAFDRRPLQRKILELRPFRAYDEEISLNTQAGSQWDGFKQWGHQRTGLYYNGLRHEDVPFANDNGIHHWTEKGGIVGRGVLLDYVAYAARKGFTYDPWTRHEITVEALEEMCAFEGVTLRQADILIVRSGFLRRYNDADPDEQVRGLQHNLCFVGLQGSERMIEWLWDHHFSALAGDTVALEAWPPQDPWIIHDYSCAMWGQPLGELWDLERLAVECEQRGRWTFFLTSAPLNIIGGIASPPNVLAIF